MKLNKPKFWNTKYSFITILLIPVTLIIILIIFLKKKFTRRIHFNIPIICVGNIYIGGTGKTPTSIYIAKELTELGKKPAILRKYYKDHRDEHNLIREKFNNLILNKNRLAGIKEAVKMNFDTVILDDGFQDYQIKTNLNILCFNQNQLIGNGLVLPAGPLREKLNSLKDADVILINGKRNIDFEKKILKINNNLEIFYSSYKPINIDQFKEQKLFVIAGIGNPDNFIKLLLDNGLNIEKKLIFPDHYEFTQAEISNIIADAKKNNFQVLMTEKDYYRINHLKHELGKIKYLKVSITIDGKEKLLKTISKLYDQIN
jgi:tetraacyldisaccharide 4'-kinase